MKYQFVPGSRGFAPHFEITLGLQEGYGSSGKLHSVDEVRELVLDHLKRKAAAGQPYLTGSVTTGTVVYAWPDGPGNSGGGYEPQATYSGEANPLYNKELSSEQIEQFLNEMATELGAALGQTRVYVAFRGEMWILQGEEAQTPTGE